MGNSNSWSGLKTSAKLVSPHTVSNIHRAFALWIAMLSGVSTGSSAVPGCSGAQLTQMLRWFRSQYVPVQKISLSLLTPLTTDTQNSNFKTGQSKWQTQLYQIWTASRSHLDLPKATALWHLLSSGGRCCRPPGHCTELVPAATPAPHPTPTVAESTSITFTWGARLLVWMEPTAHLLNCLAPSGKNKDENRATATF